MNGNDLYITFQTILAIFGAIAAIMAGVSGIAKLLNPFKELKARVDAHDESLKMGNRKFEMLEKSINAQERMQREVCKGMIVIMNHIVTGNSIDKIRNQQEELQKFLIDN